MGSALPIYLRRQIVEERAKGHKLIEISDQYHLSYSTVCNIYKRYRQEGLEGLGPHYERCGSHICSDNAFIRRAAVWLRRLHPGWGAELIAVKLQDRYKEHRVPGERTLQRWFKAFGLNKVRSRFPSPLQPWARKVHDIWQIDAKEKLNLGLGGKACYLSVVDEKSGALLKAFVFPPFLY